MDPLGEKYASYSPYNYCIGNPINLLDADGNEPGPPVSLTQPIPKAIPGTKLPGLFGELVGLAEGMNARLAPSEIMKRPSGDVLKQLYEGAANKGSLKNGGQVVRTSKSIEIDQASDQSGKIYKVSGDKTKSGKPYIGRTTQESPEKRGKGGKPDGRDRKDAEIIDTYDANNKSEGAFKEQKHIDNEGGLNNLDNKRNEVSPKNMKELEQKHGN